MKGSEMEVNSEIEACRTCGIFFLTSANYLRYLFGNESDITLVRQELQTNPSWGMQLHENDAFPKYICTMCMFEFNRIFKFQATVAQTQQQLQQLYNLQQENIQKIKIKTENVEESNIEQEPDVVNERLPDEPNVCAFIYVDDLSDDDEEERNIIPFKVPHLPIKEEVIEEAHIPKADESLAPGMSVLALTQNVKHANANVLTTAKEVTANAAAAAIIEGIQCQLCLHVSEDQQQHRQHLLRVHEEKPVECHVCGKQFPPGTTDTRLKYHMKWHRISKHIKCSQCGFHCPSRDVLNEHMRAVHTKIGCKVCGKLLLPRKMRLHLQKHQKSDDCTQKLDCPYCASYFNTNDERNQHISLFHNTASDQLTMSSFNLSSSETLAENTLFSSLQTENEETPPTSCETTTTSIASNSSSNEKSCDNIDNDDENAYDNDAAIELFDDSATTVAYSNISGETEIDATAADDNLDSYGIDEGLKFDCAQCTESFARIDQLIAHSQVHSLEKAKAFVCNVCGKDFDLKFSLNRHMKKHKNTTL